MAVSKLVSGFECEFVEKPPKASQTECPICLQVLREPYQVICCGKSFCRSCIERVKALNNPCPHCNQQNFNDFPNKGHQQFLYQYKVRCTHKQKGCDWTGELGELDNHLNVDPQPANQLKGCVFVIVKCSHCSKSRQRKLIKQHQNEECQKRPFSCKHCKVYKSTFRNVTSKHWPVCECYPVECSNKCGAVLQRRNLKSHEVKDCPLTVIDCDFYYAGCEVRLPRKDMKEHLRVELVKHTSMMASRYQQQQLQDGQKMGELMTKQLLLLAIENEAKTKKMGELVKENEAKTKKMGELVKENEAKTKENETLKQRVTKLEKEQNDLLKTVYSTPPVDFTMSNFEQHKENDVAWFSPQFYTHHRGYKLCLQCYVNGLLSPKYVSVFFCIMRGEFDDELKWPFRGEVILQLLRQDGSSRHHTKTIILNNTSCCSKVTRGERCGNGQGEYCFITHDDCKGYIKSDTLHFRIAKVVLK